MTVDRAELRRLAESATPGPWTAATWYGSDDGGWVARGPHHEARPAGSGGHDDESTNDESDEPGGPVERRAMRDAAFIAAANPSAVIALLDLVESMQAITLSAANYLDASSDKSARRAWARILRAEVARLNAVGLNNE